MFHQLRASQEGTSQAEDRWHRPLGNCTYAFGRNEAQLLGERQGLSLDSSRSGQSQQAKDDTLP